MSLTTGQILANRYRIVKRLAQGGFGTIYRAWDLSLKKNCAIKENFETSPQAHRQFEREASFLANLHHPNLPRVTDYFTIAGQGQYLVMDFIEGDDLQQMLDAKGPLPEVQVLNWITQICDALEYLHNQTPPIIHRDIKPANIKIKPPGTKTDAGRAMLVDFGIAKRYDPTSGTTIGAKAVTPGFSPQEQYGQNAITDERSDIYALGATMYNLLTGQVPPESIQRVLGATMQSPRQLNPNISPKTEAAIMKAMALSASERYKTVAEFSQALQLKKKGGVSAPFKIAIGLGVTLLFVAAACIGIFVGDWVSPTPTPVVTVVVEAPEPGDNFDASGTQTALAIEAAGFEQQATATMQAIQQTQDAVAQSPFIATTAASPASPSPSSTPKPPNLGIGATKISPKDQMPMVYVPEGEFLMGAKDDPEAKNDETPQHIVYLDAFWIDKTEVTNAMFAKFVAETGYITTAEQQGWSKVHAESGQWVNTEGADWQHPTGPGSNIKGLDHYPVLHTSWEDARSYCAWAGKRLPTEAEWEKAARGPDGRLFPWGNSINCNYAQYKDCGGKSLPVGSRPDGVSYYGAEDMAGNAWEWVADWYDANYYAYSPYENPPGPSGGEYRIQRGGSWKMGGPKYLRASNRARADTSETWETDGFRCAADP